MIFYQYDIDVLIGQNMISISNGVIDAMHNERL
jgi:hypothetical protein